jgi:hypothetical protein
MSFLCSSPKNPFESCASKIKDRFQALPDDQGMEKPSERPVSQAVVYRVRHCKATRAGRVPSRSSCCLTWLERAVPLLPHCTRSQKGTRIPGTTQAPFWVPDRRDPGSSETAQEDHPLPQKTSSGRLQALACSSVMLMRSSFLRLAGSSSSRATQHPPGRLSSRRAGCE